MFLVEKENFEKENNSNIDNDFKELDNEIDKVVHGKASCEDERTEESNSEDNNNTKHTLNSTENIDNEKDNSNNVNQYLNTNKNKINQKNNNNSKINNSNDKVYMKQFKQNFESNLNSNANSISYLNYLNQSGDIFNKIDSNYAEYIYKNNTQKMNNEAFILNNTLNDEYKNKINSTLNINQINNHNNCLGFPFNNFNQFNFFNSNGCINLNNNKNNLESYNIKAINNINNKNKLFNNVGSEKIINFNQNSIPNFAPIRGQLIINQNQKILQNSSPNNINQINNNYININFPIISSNFNQLFYNNNQYQSQNLILNQINKSENLIINSNRPSDRNNNIIPEILNKMENNYIILNRISNQMEKQNNKYKNASNLFPHQNNNNNFKISKNDTNKKGIKIFNQDNNCCKHRRKIFNPIPDSEKEKNIINLIDIIQNKDTRTTLMIKNIPNKYNISNLLEELNFYFKDTYDILYLPIDFINNCNLGFAFINFVEPLHIILFYELYRGKKWKKFNSEKICELLYAKYQGKKELIAHFEKGQILSFDSEDKKPIILPTPNPLPKINIPYYYLTFFNKLYPNVSYEIKKLQNCMNKNDIAPMKKIFSINGNFQKN